jgi:alkanesulfonate monooxygenase SsuD/methylene tetrahydromethanopterin reductase-like flavin-dependent oxidoreductase (luciferase family)
VRYAVGLPTVGVFGNASVLVDLARLAEDSGWDGIHLWDHVLYHEPGWPVVSPVVVASAVASVTARVRILLTVALPRRQVQDVALDTAAIDALSAHRLTLVAAIGSMDREYTEFGLDPSGRGAALDAGLSRLVDLWDSWDVPRVPIWCAGRWPRRAGLRRAARFDGAMPTFADQRVRNVPVDVFGKAASFVRDLAGRDIDIAVEGASSPNDLLVAYAGAGATWWVEALGWWRGDLDFARSRVAAGPPR